MSRDRIAAATSLALVIAFGVGSVMALSGATLPRLPGILAFGVLLTLLGTHMLVFRRWRAERNWMGQRTPAATVNRFRIALWAGHGIFFIAFGLLFTWAGLTTLR